MATLTELESNGEEVHRLHYLVPKPVADSSNPQVRCPVCKAGPISESQLARIASGSTSKLKRGGAVKKSLFTSSVSSSAPGSSSQTEVLTIIDSSDEEAAAAPSKAKGKSDLGLIW